MLSDATSGWICNSGEASGAGQRRDSPGGFPELAGQCVEVKRHDAVVVRTMLAESAGQRRVVVQVEDEGLEFQGDQLNMFMPFSPPNKRAQVWSGCRSAA
jgi:hypothetical protein